MFLLQLFLPKIRLENDSDSDSVMDSMLQTGGESTTVAYADMGIAVRSHSNDVALTFQFINGNFHSLVSGYNPGGFGGYVFGADFGAATSFIHGFNVADSHEYKVLAVGGDFDFWVDGVFIGHETDPQYYSNMDETWFGTVGVASFDNVVFEDFQVQYVPEPATMIMLGLGGLALLRKNRR